MNIKHINSFFYENKNLLCYTALNYLDKFFVFLAPLIILYVLNSASVYNDIEYIYSISAIFSVLLELGVRNNLLYEYKSSPDVDKLVEQVNVYFGAQIVFYFILGLIISLFFSTASQYQYIVFYIATRSIYNYIISYFNLYYRLIDKPSTIFIYSILVNVISVIVSIAFWAKFRSINEHVFFVSQTLFILLLVIFFCRRFSREKLNGFKSYLARSIKYAWPITLNIFLFMLINNYGKLYARTYLTAEEMTHISIIQRLSLFIQLAHASAAGYLSKKLFLDKNTKIDASLLILYSLMMAGGTIVTLLSFPIISYFKKSFSLPLDFVTMLLVGYTILWCYGAYFELYLNKYNRNILLPFFTGLSAIAFLLVSYLGYYDALTNICIGMFVSMAVNLSLIVASIFILQRGSSV